MKEALRGNRSGTAALGVIVLAVVTAFGSWAAAAGRTDGPSFMTGVILNAVLPMVVLGVVLAAAGLQRDRTLLPASVSLALIPAAMASAWLIGWISRA